MRVVATGALDRTTREYHLVLAHVVYWHDGAAALTLVLVTGDTFLVQGEDRERVREGLLALEQREV